MKNWKWYLSIVLVLILSSALFYLIQIIIFHKTGDTFFYMLQDISFVPIQVLFVTFVLDRLMKRREKESFLNKLNMVIGVFYNDIGVDFIKSCNNFIQDIAETGRGLTISSTWTDRDFNSKRLSNPSFRRFLILDNVVSNGKTIGKSSLTIWAMKRSEED